MNDSLIGTCRSDFPILHNRIHDRPLVYLDNAATTQKPSAVIQSISEYYSTINANVHRGVYTISQQATDLFENTRETVRKYIGATSTSEIIFTKSATESINLVASSYGEIHFKHDDEIILTMMEHHANIIPWQEISKRKVVKLK